VWWAVAIVAAAGAFTGGYAVSWRAERRSVRRDPAFGTQEGLIRHLWETARRLPAGTTLTDPVTGRSLGTERAGGFLTLLVADPPAGPGDQPGTAIVHRYPLGFARRPIRPPLMHDITPAGGEPARISWRQARQAVRLAEQTGAGDTGPGELASLVIQLDRAVAATR
jgi:hypothetical protein